MTIYDGSHNCLGMVKLPWMLFIGDQGCDSADSKKVEGWIYATLPTQMMDGLWDMRLTIDPLENLQLNLAINYTCDIVVNYLGVNWNTVLRRWCVWDGFGATDVGQGSTLYSPRIGQHRGLWLMKHGASTGETPTKRNVMSDRKHVDFNSIHNGMKSHTGRFRIASNGIGWKGTAGDPIVLSPDDLRKFMWMRAARGYQLRVSLKDNQVLKFDGFRNDDIDAVKDALKSFYKKDLEVKEPSVKGWNWGKTDFQGSNLTFNVSNKPLFELPLAQAIGANKAGKNEVSINFVDPGQPAPDGVNPKEVDELMDVTFYIPGTVAAKDSNNNSDEEDVDDEEVNADAVFYDNVKSKLEFSQMTTENIVQFQEVLCLTPRGRYNIDMYQDFLRLRGKTYDYKIMYSNIIKLFLLLKPDEVHVLFVMGLDPPLRQGQTKYPFLVFQFVREDEIDVDLNLDDTKLDEKYENKLQKHYEAPTYEVVSTIFRALTGRKVTVPGTYRSHHGAHALKCSMKANEGYLYPLEKSFLFIPKPTTFIPFNEIGVVNFTRVGTQSGGSSRTFDMKFHMKSGSDIQFSSINREEYSNLEDFLRQKNIKVKSENVQETVMTYTEIDDDEDEDEMNESRKKRTKVDVDMGDEDEESPDEDFAPNDSASDVAEEYDSDAQGSSDGGSDEE